jgi:hypothetical protein
VPFNVLFKTNLFYFFIIDVIAFARHRSIPVYIVFAGLLLLHFVHLVLHLPHTVARCLSNLEYRDQEINDKPVQQNKTECINDHP